MRNIFDQYEQQENRLTHALATVLAQDDQLLVSFLKWLGIDDVPKRGNLTVTQQQIPGEHSNKDYNEDNSDSERGIPDLMVCDSESWAVLFESKIQSKLSQNQLKRHRDFAVRRGFNNPWTVVLTVDELSRIEGDVIFRQWREVYTWFNLRSKNSFWAAQLVDYMRTFEQKNLATKYQIRGTITMFDGLRFTDDEPYNYREAKRLIRLLGDQLQADPRLKQLDIDPNGPRRPAITGQESDGVWDFLPLLSAQNSKNFTAFPHLTISIKQDYAAAAITIPNGLKGGFKSKLEALQFPGFQKAILEVEKGLRSTIQRSPGSKPMIYAVQRHFLGQRSLGEIDACIEVDLRTTIKSATSRVKYQPQWLESIYEILVNKQSNIQFGLSVHFQYGCPLLGSQKATDLFVDTWLAMAPILALVGGETE